MWKPAPNKEGLTAFHLLEEKPPTNGVVFCVGFRFEDGREFLLYDDEGIGVLAFASKEEAREHVEKAMEATARNLADLTEEEMAAELAYFWKNAVIREASLPSIH